MRNSAFRRGIAGVSKNLVAGGGNCRVLGHYTVAMSASDAHVLSAVAFQLAAAVDAYDEDITVLVRSGFDPEVYRRVSRQMDQMRMYAAALPPVSVSWVEVMIRHFELTHGLWRVQKDGSGAAELRAVHQQLQQSLQRLSRLCAQLMPAA